MRRATLIAILAALALPASAGANYVLRHPEREHCRHGYVRHRHGRTVECVRVPRQPPRPAAPVPGAPVTAAVPAPAPTAAPVPTAASEEPSERDVAEGLRELEGECGCVSGPEE